MYFFHINIHSNNVIYHRPFIFYTNMSLSAKNIYINYFTVTHVLTLSATFLTTHVEGCYTQCITAA